jgi:hypothetical protein
VFVSAITGSGDEGPKFHSVFARAEALYWRPSGAATEPRKRHVENVGHWSLAKPGMQIDTALSRPVTQQGAEPMKRHLCWLIVYVLLFGAQRSYGDGPEIAWEETFEDPNCLARANFFTWDRYSQGGWDDALLIKEFRDGSFRFGLKYDATRKSDWVNLVYGDIVWGRDDSPEWGPFDLKRYPIIEIRWRGSPFTLYFGKETASGQKQQDYTGSAVHRKEIDQDGREWNVSLIRIAADSSVPGPHTATKLLGINPHINTPLDGRDRTVEIDYIRIRGLTAEELLGEAMIIETLKDFPPSRWKGLDSFFPWGVYDTGFLRGDFEWWGGDYEGAFNLFSRHHINFIAGSYEIEIARVGGPELTTDDWRVAVDRYEKAVKPLTDAARANGLRRAADMRYLMQGRDPREGFEQILPIAERITQQIHGDDDITVAWKIADEPGADKLLPLVSSIRALRESDPHDRPELVVFNSLTKMAAYAPYVSVCYWDSYPVHGGARNPWSIRNLAREYRRLLPDQPMWPVLQAFETNPPNDSTYTRPSDSEMRLMAYLTLAEGAKGIVWFSGYHSGHHIHLVNRTGYPFGGMLRTVATLGERLIPLGRQLIATEPDDKLKISVSQRTEPTDGDHLLSTSLLKYRNGAGYLLVAVNEDLERIRRADVKILDPPLKRQVGVYDLYALDGANLQVDGKFEIAPLAGGDGRLYAVCSEESYGRISKAIRCDAAVEDVRVLMPDLAIARRWGLDVSEVDEYMASCRKSAASGEAGEAIANAHLAERVLRKLIRDSSELSMTRRALEDMQMELNEVWRVCEHFDDRTPRWWTGRDHPMFIPNAGHLELSKRYFEVGRSFRDVFTRYLHGRKDGLWDAINNTRVTCLEMREDVLAMLREKLEPAAPANDAQSPD